MQRADQPQLVYVHMYICTRPLDRDESIYQRKWEREHAGYLLFISGIMQLTANTTQPRAP